MDRDKQVSKWIKEACRKCRCPRLASQITFEFHPRFTRRGGDCDLYRKKLRFSEPLWPRMSETQRRQTVIHETCHLIRYTLYGHTRTYHDDKWKLLMVICGAEPDRCHDIDSRGLGRKYTRYQVKCSCRTLYVGSVRKRNLEKGKVYLCIHCRRPVTLTGVVTKKELSELNYEQST